VTSWRARVAFAAVTVLVMAAPGAVAQDAADAMIERAALALRRDAVYVHPDAASMLEPRRARDLRARIENADAGPIYIAVFPEEARLAAGGSTEEVVNMLRDSVGERGTYAVVAGSEMRAASNLHESGVPEIATQAVAEAGGGGADAVLIAFVDGMAGLAQGGSQDDGSGLGFLPLLLLVGGGFFLLSSLRRRRAGDAERRRQLSEVRQAARDDLVALGEDLRASDIDVSLADGNSAAKADYERALGCYERASTDLDRARRPEDMAAVSAALEEGRFAMASARARLEGRALPERRAPCVFDPRHGPSARDVKWAPPGGAPRAVPACEADAARVERGEEPATRSVTVDGRDRPYYDAPGYYGPWAGGYFGGFGLFEGFLLGSWLSGGFGGFGGDGSDGGEAAAEGGAGDGDVGGDDFGGGDFGGGDFGGGDFGGGDFAGGDFGGGDFGG
jgi:hypothetical protein